MSETLLQPLLVPGGFYSHLCAYSKETPRKMHSCELNLTADEIKKKVVKWALTTSCPNIRPPLSPHLIPLAYSHSPTTSRHSDTFALYLRALPSVQNARSPVFVCRMDELGGLAREGGVKAGRHSP